MRIADPVFGRVMDAAHSSSVPWGELARAECVVPQTPADVAELEKAILHRKRKHCLDVLTARRGGAAPAVSAMAVREIVGSAIPVYFLREELTAHLAILRPPAPDVRSGGVRVYWPGVDSNPWGHPLVYSPAGESEERILDTLGRIFTPERIAIAAPVHNDAREVIGAINLAAHQSTIPLDELVDEFRTRLVSTAEEISALYGTADPTRSLIRTRDATRLG